MGRTTEQPKTVFDFLVWAFSQKSGGLIILGFVVIVALWRVYSDWREDMSLWRSAVTSMSQSHTETTSVLNQVAREISANTSAILKLSAEAEVAHRTSP